MPPPARSLCVPAVGALLLIAMAGCSGSNNASREGSAAVDEPTALTTATPVAACIEPPAGPVPDPPDLLLNVSVGDTVELKGAEFFPEAGATTEWTWSQRVAEADELSYFTVHPASIASGTDGVYAFTPSAPGNYGFNGVSAGGIERRVDVLVSAEAAYSLEAKGAVFGDVFGELGGPQFNLDPPDAGCREAVLGHAMAGPVESGLGFVAFTPAAFIVQVRPVPVFGLEPHLSLESDGTYRFVIAAAKNAGLKVVHIESEAPGLDLTAEQLADLEVAKTEAAWWSAWFDAWETWIVPRAAAAEALGVDVFVPFLLADFAFPADVYPEYANRWRDILEGIRGVFSGTIGMSISVPDARMTFADAFDLAFVSLDSGQYTWDPERMADPKNPTFEELVAITEQLLDDAERMHTLGVPVYLIYQAGSSDGQGSSESIEVRQTIQVDFAEQAAYYEALFFALQDEPWVRGVFTERWDWFDQFDRGGASPEAIYFDNTIEGSPRSKPAGQVLELWLGAY